MAVVDVFVNGPCCSGCMACVELAPEIFAFDEATGAVVVLQSPCEEDTVYQAAAYCPEDCIEIYKD